MELGVMALATDRTVSVPELAVMVEERGLGSLFLGEHTHMPVERRSKYPAGEPLSEEFRRFVDPLIALAAAASVTTRIELGTAVMLVPQHDPVLAAKQIATLDHLSGGRVVLGVGFGWNDDELANHGKDPADKRAIAREHMLAMERLWSQEKAAFSGEHVEFSSSWCWPKPAGRARPEVLVGGAPGPGLFDHVIEYGDGWIPIGGSGLERWIPELRERAERVGRDPNELSVSVLAAYPDLGRLEHYAEMGVARAIFTLPPVRRFGEFHGVERVEAEPHLDQFAELREQLLG